MSKRIDKKTTSKKKKDQTSNFAGKYTKLLWLGVLAGLTIAALIFTFVAKTQIPDTQELENPHLELASPILADDGRELGRAFRINREQINFKDLNPHLVNALVATEDERFYNHSGIDARGTLRAVVFMGSKGGASTITQQLAKQFFTKRSRSFPIRVWQKLKEWVVAVEFEKRYTKEEIIAMYLNKAEFVYDAYGIGAAAKTYFGKDQKDLKIEEAAVLIGMLKNPNLYNPIRFPENANKRRSTVLKQMVRNDFLTNEEYKELTQDPIDISNYRRAFHYDGPAPYFRSFVTQEVKNLLKQDQYSKPDGSTYNIFTDGLKIYTTIDYDMQHHAEQAMKKHMSQLQKKYFEKWKKLDPWTYNADEKQKNIRLSNLKREVRETPRFKKMRRGYLSGVSNKLSNEIENVRLWDTDIFRLFNAEKDASILPKYVKNGTIRKDQSKVYKQILKSEHWPELKKQWLALQQKSKKVFNKPVKMKVFDHTQGEKWATMTPLDSIKYHHMHLQLGSVSVEPSTGYVKTWIGGVGFKYFQYDHTHSNRQVGSTFKPFVYATAIVDLAMSPCTKVKDTQYAIPAGEDNFKLLKAWAPPNSNNKFSEEDVTLKQGLKKSLNSVALYLMKEIGNTERVRQFAANMGLPKSKIPNQPSICLGTPELSVMDMAGAYTAFSNNGVHTDPVYIKRIEDKHGRVIYNGTQEQKTVLTPGDNYVMVDMLRNASSFIQPGLQSEIGGKTGTTNDHKDGWFLGITPDLVVATWVGADRPWIRFRNIADGQGGKMARPFFVEFLKRMEADPSITYDKTKRFTVPDTRTINTDCGIYAAMQEKDEKEKQREKNDLEEYDEEFEENF